MTTAWSREAPCRQPTTARRGWVLRSEAQRVPSQRSRNRSIEFELCSVRVARNAQRPRASFSVGASSAPSVPASVSGVAQASTQIEARLPSRGSSVGCRSPPSFRAPPLVAQPHGDTFGVTSLRSGGASGAASSRAQRRGATALVRSSPVRGGAVSLIAGAARSLCSAVAPASRSCSARRALVARRGPRRSQGIAFARAARSEPVGVNPSCRVPPGRAPADRRRSLADDRHDPSLEDERTERDAEIEPLDGRHLRA